MMVSVMIRVTVALLLTAFVAFGLRRASAAVRHAVWAVGLFVSLVLPLANLALPAWSVVPASFAASTIATEAAGVVSPTGAGADTGAALLPLLYLIWGVGALCVLVRIVLGELALAAWKRRAHPVLTEEWLAAIHATAGGMRQSRHVTFLECDWVDTPCTWGTISPTVLLPSAGAQWSQTRRQCALIHELAHVRRFDAATNLLGRMCCAVHWYNPLVWMVARQARVAQEEACDNAVLAEQVAPSEYAALLLDVCNKGRSRGSDMIAALGLVRNTGTETRVRSLLDAQRSRSPVGTRVVALVSIFGVATLLSVATASPAQVRRNPQTTPDSATMAQIVKRICEGRSAPADTNVVARFTIRGRLNQGSDRSGRIVEYTVHIKGCGGRAK